MNINMKHAYTMIALILSLGLTACGQGFKVVGSGGVAGQSIDTVADIKSQLDEAEKATADAETAMAEAQAAIASISDSNGNIDIDVFSVNSGAAPQGLLAPILERLQTVFDTVLSKVQLVTQKFDLARAALEQALTKLNPSNPAEAAMIAQINEALSKIDFLESQFRSVLQMLAGKLDIAMAALDNLMNTACSFIPIPGLCAIAGVIVDTFLMNDVKALIAHFKSQLLAL